MNIELTIYGQVYMAFAVLIGVLCYREGQSKSDSAISAGVIGFVLSIFQPFGLFYLLYLWIKSPRQIRK